MNASCRCEYESTGHHTWQCRHCGNIRQNTTGMPPGRPCTGCGGRGGEWRRQDPQDIGDYVACTACAGTGRSGIRLRA